jgi:hypothetical protein
LFVQVVSWEDLSPFEDVGDMNFMIGCRNYKGSRADRTQSSRAGSITTPVGVSGTYGFWFPLIGTGPA